MRNVWEDANTVVSSVFYILIRIPFPICIKFLFTVVL